MKKILTILLALVTLLLINTTVSFAVAKSPKTVDGSCAEDNDPFNNFDYINYYDKDGDGKYDHCDIAWCDNSYTMNKEIIPPLSFLPTGENGNIDVGKTRVGEQIVFTYKSISPTGVTQIRDVQIFHDSLAGDIGIVYGSIEKNSSGEYKAFEAPLQVSNPNNNGWTFADVHGQSFMDTTRGTMVNELYDNLSNALVGIQYFPNGGPAVTFFFYTRQ